MLESAKRLGICVDVMPCNSFMEKPAVLKRYLNALPADAVVLCTDGYDVLYVQKEDLILSKFKAFDSPLVFSGEKGCYHHFPETKDYFEKSREVGQYRYLNSGLIMGHTAAYHEMLDEVVGTTQAGSKDFEPIEGAVGFLNDQTLFGRYAAQRPDKVAIDTRADLFWTITEEKYNLGKYAKVNSDGVKNLESNTEPCLVHVPHRQKSYPGYLEVALKMGIKLTAENVDLQLIDGFLKDRDKTDDHQAITMDPILKKTIKSLLNGGPCPEKPVDKNDTVC